jgi:hypothetical protein
MDNLFLLASQLAGFDISQCIHGWCLFVFAMPGGLGAGKGQRIGEKLKMMWLTHDSNMEIVRALGTQKKDVADAKAAAKLLREEKAEAKKESKKQKQAALQNKRDEKHRSLQNQPLLLQQLRRCGWLKLQHPQQYWLHPWPTAVCRAKC